MKLSTTLVSTWLLSSATMWACEAQKSLQAFNRLQGNRQFQVSNGLNRFQPSKPFNQFNRTQPNQFVQQRQMFNRQPAMEQRRAFPQLNVNRIQQTYNQQYTNPYNNQAYQMRQRQPVYQSLPANQTIYNNYTPQAWQQRGYNSIPSWYTGGIGQNRVGMPPGQRGGRINLR